VLTSPKAKRRKSEERQCIPPDFGHRRSRVGEVTDKRCLKPLRGGRRFQRVPLYTLQVMSNSTAVLGYDRPSSFARKLRKR